MSGLGFSGGSMTKHRNHKRSVLSSLPVLALSGVPFMSGTTQVLEEGSVSLVSYFDPQAVKTTFSLKDGVSSRDLVPCLGGGPSEQGCGPHSPGNRCPQHPHVPRASPVTCWWVLASPPNLPPLLQGHQFP